MGKIKWIGSLIGHYKYLIVIVLGIALVGFADEESIMQRSKLRMEISDIETEIATFSKQYEADSARLKELKRDPKAVVKIAREQYFMKTDEEDIYVLSDDNSGSDGKK